jgi:hypothetical protein
MFSRSDKEMSGAMSFLTVQVLVRMFQNSTKMHSAELSQENPIGDLLLQKAS